MTKRSKKTTEQETTVIRDSFFEKFEGEPAVVRGETGLKLIHKRRAFALRFIKYAKSTPGKKRDLFAVTFTFPPSAAEGSLYGDMIQLARRVSRTAHDSLWVVAAQDKPKEPERHHGFHWHGIAMIGSETRDQRWFKNQWARRVGANRSAIDVGFLKYSDRRDSKFEESAVRWINYCCRAPNPSLPLPLKVRVVASGRLATLWTEATGYAPVDTDFAPHFWSRQRQNDRHSPGTAQVRSRHGPCRCGCGLMIPDERRLGAKFFDKQHRINFHNAKKMNARHRGSNHDDTQGSSKHGRALP